MVNMVIMPANINILLLIYHVSIATMSIFSILIFTLEHYCVQVQPHKTASMTHSVLYLKTLKYHIICYFSCYCSNY